MKKIAIIDYGVGNLLSIKRALDFVDIKSVITNNKKIIESSSHLILPGVGAFLPAINILQNTEMDSVVKNFAKSGKPLLGICLGMQLLFQESQEFGNHKGLNLIQGKVKKINIPKENIPIIGWYKVQFSKKNKIFKKYYDEYLYLVHSFECVPENKKDILGTYMMNKRVINCAVQKNNILGLQFHPEKSSYVGIKILKEFSNL